MRYSYSSIAFLLGVGIFAAGPIAAKSGPFAADVALAEDDGGGSEGSKSSSDAGGSTHSVSSSEDDHGVDAARVQKNANVDNTLNTDQEDVAGAVASPDTTSNDVADLEDVADDGQDNAATADTSSSDVEDVASGAGTPDGASSDDADLEDVAI